VISGVLAATVLAVAPVHATDTAAPRLMHEQGNAGMHGMHELYMQGNPGMQRMHGRHAGSGHCSAPTTADQ
jgi:hypothetical protein